MTQPNDPTNQPLRIAVLGMDKQTLRLLEMVFNGPGRGDYTLVEPIDTAGACIQRRVR